MISYGGTQSNAMLALAAICKMKNWEFIYYSKPINSVMQEQNFGNLFESINLGMNHIELEHEVYQDFISSIGLNLEDKTFIIDLGGANSLAKEGLDVLATEIRESNLSVKSLATPSGTGTTALYLALSLPEYTIYTTPCVGDIEYLKKQMQALHALPENLVILKPSKKYHFAKPYPEFFDLHQKCLSAGLEFDLLYAPLMWKALLENVSDEVLYIHSGGVRGYRSMLERYEKKGMSL
jgi:1-aminocyclopropane-1-carboxylate deaminase/D-cysteine desulfhydrase-like pyridoxal-dependent ACC family enzyme